MHQALTAYDRFFLAGHQALQARGLPGHYCIASLELNGELDPATLRRAVAGAVRAHPLLGARIGYSIVTGRAYWSVGDAAPDAVAAEIVTFRDVERMPDPTAAIRNEVLAGWNERQAPEATPQIRLWQFRAAADRHVVVLRWPHYLADLEGAEVMLQAIAAAGDARGASANAATTASATDRPDVLRHPSQWRDGFARSLIRGLRLSRRTTGIDGCRLPDRGPPAEPPADFAFGRWPATSEQFAAAAQGVCRPGPMLYTRLLAVALLRSLHDLRDSLGLTGEQYVIPLPLLRPRTTPRTVAAANDLTILTLAVPCGMMDRPLDVDASLQAQIAAYTTERHDEATWAAMSFAGWLRARHYRRLVASGRIVPPHTSGFAVFRVEPTFREFLGCRIEALSACGLPTIPPGAMCTFCRADDRLDLGVAFFPHVIRPENVRQLVERVGEHLGLKSAPHPLAAVLR